MQRILTTVLLALLLSCSSNISSRIEGKWKNSYSTIIEFRGNELIVDDSIVARCSISKDSIGTIARLDRPSHETTFRIEKLTNDTLIIRGGEWIDNDNDIYVRVH